MAKLRAVKILAAALVPASFCACSKEPERAVTTAPTPTTVFEAVVEGGTTAPYFRLSALPELEPYKPPQQIYSRAYDERTYKLIASDDYGELVPFRGAALSYYAPQAEEHGDYEGSGVSGYFSKSPIYGLATLEGKIVVDPVYNRVERRLLDNGKAVYFLYKSDVEKIETVSVASSDGSWIIEGGYTTGGAASENRIILGVSRETSQGEYTSDYSVFDYNGRFIFKIENISHMGSFSDGLSDVHYSELRRGEYVNKSYFVDLNGKKVLGDYDGHSGEFSNGYAPIIDGSFEGYIDTSGRKSLAIPFESKQFYNSKDYWRIINDETGLGAQGAYVGDEAAENLFFCTDSEGNGYIYGFDGKTRAKLYGISEIAAANDLCFCAFATDKNGEKKYYIIDIKTGKTLEEFGVSYGSDGYRQTYAYHYYSLENVFEISEYDEKTDESSTRLYDCERRKIIYEGKGEWNETDIFKINDVYYYGRYDGDYSLLYDENDKIIMRVNTNSTD